MSSEHQLDELGSFFTTSLVKIITGHSKKEYYVNSGALLSCGSSSLNALVNGGWKESKEGVIDWTEFDYKTIERFLIFLYTRDYPVPDPEPNNMIYDEEEEEIEAPEPTKAATDKLETNLQEATADFLEPRPLTPMSRCVFGLPLERRPTAAGLFTQTEFESDSHFGITLLAHAKMYTFAHYHLVSELERFALQRLNQVLISMDCTQAHAIPDIAQLVYHIYDNTTVRELQEEPARKLVSQFIALNYTNLMKGELQTLLVKGGDFVLDLSDKIFTRLRSGGSSSKLLESQIDELEAEVRALKTTYIDQESKIQRLEQELTEWRSWKAGSSRKLKGRY
ncbi:hypothetical protein AOQ84DRAFT_366993 [Glonium stellatum]|uniref:BTB domain-containing protein n=1 Tax=Glonium stellatum TaxID=574774 RepID=A0A8E2EUE1_9PEZI|nr:hypothetical protein AOQ84DRAFT_366993 [Glonium stellatum]